MPTFDVHLAPGNKKQTAAQVRSDMAPIKSGIVFNTERESTVLRAAVSAGLGHGWTRVLENEDTIAYGSHFTAAGTPTALLLAHDDPHKAKVSGDRHLDRVPLLYAGLPKPIKAKGTHFVSEANCEHIHIFARAWREKTFKIQLADTIADLKVDHTAGIPQILAGDFNTGIFYTGDQLFAALKKEFGADVVHAYNGKLDHIFLISAGGVRLTAGKPKITKNSSDHDRVTVKVTATLGAAPATPPVKAEPPTTIRTGPQAIARADASTTNTPGMCQNWTWNLYQAHAVGDVDHNGRSNAIDGWLSEPAAARFTDRRPWIGAPVAFSGGSEGDGHRCITKGYLNGEPILRSTDAAGSGHVGDRPLSWFEEHWGLHYLGWSKTISGVPINDLVAPPKTSTGTPPPAAAPNKMDPAAYFIGAKGDHVTWLGQRLVAHGQGAFYKTGPGPTFTATDKKAVAAFQKAQGWSGADADGLPGEETLKRLAATPAAKPTTTASKGLVLDWSFDKLTPSRVKAMQKLGVVGVARYISQGSAKDLTKAEVKMIKDAGWFITPVFESTANRAGQGAAAGKADVARAEKVLDGLGCPDDVVVWYAVDFDATPAKVQAYFRAVTAGSKRLPGDYGSYSIVEAGLTKYHWQTPAWSHGKVSTKAHMLQQVGGARVSGTDENHLLQPFPVWKP